MSRAGAAPDEAFIAALQAALAGAADPQRALPMQAYMKSTLPFLGIAAPERRRLTASVVRAHPLGDVATLAATMQALWQRARHREERYAALELARVGPHARLQGLALLPVYEAMIRSGAWWDYCDDISGNGLARLLRQHPDALEPVLRRWAVGDDLWLRRAAMLCQRRLKVGFDAPLLYATILPSIGEAAPFAREFFIRKGIGWALRERSYAAPDEVRAFCEHYAAQLSPLTLREALKAIRRRDVRSPSGRRTSSAAPASP